MQICLRVKPQPHIHLHLQREEKRAMAAAFVFPSILSVSVPHRRRIVLPKSSPLSSPSSSSSSPLSAESEPEESFPIQNGLGCKACGRREIERGCNGEGRIQGGIATVPGFGWWPIKAYRPCPGFLASGGTYLRQGQTMDDVVSGGATATTKLKPNSRTGPTKFKKKRSATS